MKTRKAKYKYFWDHTCEYAIRSLVANPFFSERWDRKEEGIVVSRSFLDWENEISRAIAPIITYRQWFNWVHFGKVPEFTMPTLDTKEVMEVTTTTTTTPITNETSNH